MADVTRDQFDEDKEVIRKVAQKGIFLADADLNEQFQATQRSQQRIISCFANHESKRFGQGFRVDGTGASLAVTIKAGFAAYQIGTNLAALLRLAEDYTLAGFAAWSGARTDHIYIDIWEDEIAPADDPNIVNPDIGAETMRDIRQMYSFEISEGGAPGAAPAGHTYIVITTVTKTSGSTIASGEVTNLIAQQEILADGAVTTAKLADDAATQAKIADDAVGTAELINNAVTKDKLNADVAGEGLSLGAAGLDVVGLLDSVAGTGMTLKLGVVEIGDWNMDASNGTSVAHGLGLDGGVRILFAAAVIFRDGPSTHQRLLTASNDAAADYDCQGEISWAGSTFSLYRKTGGRFDGTDYDATTFNRGYITFLYYDA